MGLIMVIGGQLGSESKGKVANYMYDRYNAVAAVRVGGPNSGHTAYDKHGRKIVTRCLPVTCYKSGSQSIIAAGSYIDLNILRYEIAEYNVPYRGLFIDANAVVLNSNAAESEEGKGLGIDIGSTCTGTGEGVIARVSRNGTVRLAKDVPELSDLVYNTREIVSDLISKGDRVIVEGTQGYGLSVLHTDYYPYCTSRDTTAAGFLSEIGLSPFDVERIVMCLRTYPIRVGGNSGPMHDEITWGEIRERCGANEDISEYTTVTKRLRRVGEFDAEMVKAAIKSNKPTDIVLNFCDYYDYECHGSNALTGKAYDCLGNIELDINHKIDYAGTGPRTMFGLW